MIDILEKNKINSENKLNCLDEGFVRLVDIMPRVVEDDEEPTGDFAIVQAARVSYGKGTKTVNQDRGLIRYLMRHRHTSPFELTTLKFHAKLPIFVARQWVRHRTASLNEYSGRYSVMSDEFYTPEKDRIQTQSKTNNQGTEEDGDFSLSTQLIMQNRFIKSQEDSLKEYKRYLNIDMARELARINLPVSNYTEWYWQINLHNLFHFLKLRMDSHSQYEIRVYAEAMYNLIKPIFPLACEAFEDYVLNGKHFSNSEISLIEDMLKVSGMDLSKIEQHIDVAKNLSKREKIEFKNKLNL